MGQSLLETALALHQHVSTLSSDSPLPLHPLALHSTDPLNSLAQLRVDVHRQLALLRQGIAHFPLQLSSEPSTDPDPASPIRDRYLSQLKDAAASQSAVLALQHLGTTTRAESRQAAESNWERDRYRVETPRRTRQGPTTLQLLEQIAQNLDLVTFRDHEDDVSEHEQGGDVAMANGIPVTLSVGGKLMVVDFTAPSSRSNRIDRVKVAYVVDGHDKQSPLAARKLERLFSSSAFSLDSGPDGTGEDRDEDDEERDEREQTRWKGVRRLLGELKSLDNVAERTGRDAFEELEQLTSHLESVSSRSTEPADASAKLPLRLLQPRDSLYPTLIYHATPAARLGENWRGLFPDSASTSTAPPSSTFLSRAKVTDALGGSHAAASQGCGIYAVQLELVPVSPKPAADGGATGAAPSTLSSTPRPLFLARLVPTVPIHAETGRAVLDALEINVGGAGAGSEAGSTAMMTASVTGGEDPGTRKTPPSGDKDDKEDTVDRAPAYPDGLAAATGASTAEEGALSDYSGAQRDYIGHLTTSPGEQSAGGPVAYEQALPPSAAAMVARPLLLRYYLPSLPTSRSGPPSMPEVAFFEAYYLAFRSVPHLVAALAILARQAQLNELVRNLVDDRFGVARVALESPSVGADKQVRKIGLEDLFAPPAPTAPLLVPISVGTGSPPVSATAPTTPTPTPTLALSFPFPDFEAAPPDLLGLPLSLQFSLPAYPSTANGGLDVALVAPEQILSFLGLGSEAATARDELEARVRRIVCETGVIGLAVAEVVRTLQRQATR
ncbi:hypothetical protein JCM3774_002431 [Rhodotorula dairenensis]